jgi:outer membrane protein assembly factor BamA
MGVALFIAVFTAQVQVDERPPIVSVEIHLPAASPPELLEHVSDLISVRVGQDLSPRGVQRSIENLYATGKLAQVEVTGVRLANGVALTFELTPRRAISDLYLEGNKALATPELLTISGLKAGEEYWAERANGAAQAIEQRYRRRGFAGAKVSVQTSLDEDGATVGLIVSEGEPTRISAVAAVGDPGLEHDVILAELRIGPGSVYDLENLQKGLEQLKRRYSRERFYRAKIEGPQLSVEGRLVIPVAAGPRYSLVMSGNRRVSDESLKAVVAYDGEETLDRSLALRLAAKIARFYRMRGFYAVRVVPSEHLRPGTNQAALGFSIDEGRPLRVVDIDFDGNRAISDVALREVLRRTIEVLMSEVPFEAHATDDPMHLQGRGTQGLTAEFPSPDPTTVFDDGAWTDAASEMARLYREQGYLRAKVRLGAVELQGGEARVRFIIEEGPQAVFGAVRLEGLPPGAAVDGLATAKPGAPFNASTLEQLRQSVVRQLGRRGYLFSSAKLALTEEAGGRTVAAVITIVSGPKVRVRTIIPVGNEKTDDHIILSRATIKEGEPLDSEALYSTQNALVSLGVFRTVDVELLTPDRPEPLKTVLLKVKERPRMTGEFGIGYFLAEGPRLVLDGSAPNLGGRALNLTFHGQLNFFAASWPALSRQVDLVDLPPYAQLGGRANLSLQTRSIFPTDFGVRFDVVAEHVFRPQFRFARFAGVPTIDWSKAFELPKFEWAHPKLNLAAQYEIEWSRVQRTGSSLRLELPSSLVDQQRLRFRFGSFALQTARFSPTLDVRDSALAPRRGLLLQGSFDLTGALSAIDEFDQPVAVHFLKVSGLATAYFPLPRALVVAVSLRGGRIVPLAAGSSTPPVKRFFLGGATSMRGFNEDQLIAQDVREQYRQEVRDCRLLVTKDGCTSAATTIHGGRQVPSQGGELFGLLKIELRIPASNSFELAAFFEAGNLWLDLPSLLTAFRPVAGVGIRYLTPIGPLALDLGVNLSPDAIINEPGFVVHFNIGVF